MNRRDALKSALAISLGTAVSSHAAVIEQVTREQKEQPDEDRNRVVKVRETVLRYLASWNERDAKRRLDLVSRTWIDGGTYIDRVPEGHDYESISALIAKAQIPFPGYRTYLVSGIENHHEYVRFSWAAGGAPDTPIYIKGTDIAMLASDFRFKSVIGFVDVAPVAGGR